jgi:hypothetical protein
MRGERIKLCQGSMQAGEVAQHHLNKRCGKLAVGGKFLCLSLSITLRLCSSTRQSTVRPVTTKAMLMGCRYIVCARQSIRRAVQEVVQPQTGIDVKLVDFDLEPYDAWGTSRSESEGAAEAAQSHHQRWVASRIAEGISKRR